MKKHLKGLLLIILTGLFAAPAMIASPLNAKNRFMPHFLFLTPSPDTPCIDTRYKYSLSLATDYSSIFLNNASNTHSAIIDMEMLTAELSMTYQWAGKFGIEVSVPWVQMTGGFLDGFLESYHTALGVPNYGREARPHNSFAYGVQKNNEILFTPNPNTFMPADGTLALKYRFSTGTKKFQAAVKIETVLPVGQVKYGTGTDKTGHGLSLLTRISDGQWALYLNPGFFYVQDPTFPSGGSLNSQNMVALFTGFELLPDPHWHLNVQLNCYTSPFENTGISKLDHGSIELSFGLRYILSTAYSAEVSFSEDLTRGAPDFTVHSGITYQFGKRP